MARPDLPFSADHRPWSPPARPWVGAQRWHGLLFAHWPLPLAALRTAVPEALPVDTHGGQAWIGIVPFFLSGLRLRGLPSLPGLSAFPELNVRTYVTLGGKPGVYFFSLDAGNPFAVAAARCLSLPYFYARMAVRRQGDLVSYASRRVGSATPPVVFQGRYRPIDAAGAAEPGSLAHWLTERYCLYTVDRRGRPRRLEIHHPPWPLQAAAADVATNTMASPAGVRLPDVPPLLHYAHRQDMIMWAPEAVTD